MILYRTWIQNKTVVHRTYWAGSEDDETKKVKDEILKVFPDETFPFPMYVWGVKMGGNKYTIHNCSCSADYKDSSKIQNSLLIDKDFIKYFYDLDTKTKTIEIVYKKGQAMPVVAVPSNINVDYVTDMCDANFDLLNTPAIYVSGNVRDIYAWADTLNSNISKPISAYKKIEHDDCFKFQFDANKKLTEITLVAHLERYQVWGDDNKQYVEYTCDYADELTNIDSTEIVIPNYDNHGNRIAQSQSKEDIKEYIKVPKSDGSGGYDTVPLKDL